MKLIRGKKQNKMAIQKCSKSGDIIEPIVKDQCWINCKKVTKKAIDEANSEILKVIPEFHKQALLSLLENKEVPHNKN